MLTVRVRAGRSTRCWSKIERTDYYNDPYENMDQNLPDAPLVHGVAVTPFHRGVSQPPFFTTRPQDAANLCIRGTYPEGRVYSTRFPGICQTICYKKGPGLPPGPFFIAAPHPNYRASVLPLLRRRNSVEWYLHFLSLHSGGILLPEYRSHFHPELSASTRRGFPAR